ncbi:MAG: right-handed parallel beta-helix repeat-containing protein [Clostridia bacterium]|nr:right-handed parallel beta-helix repeat-containing protein [Clostridia bacterium]
MTKKSNRIGYIVICLLLTLAIAFLGSYAVTLWKETYGEPSTPETPVVDDRPLNERLETVTGAYTLTVSGANELIVSDDGATQLGVDGAEIVVDGGADGATVRATGDGAGAIQAEGSLTFKNITFKDETPKGVLEPNYLAFDGVLRFENCVFEDSISLKTNTNASFVDCRFISSISRCYSVWVTSGSAYFTNCTFTGYRGLKIHEASTSVDVVEVTVDGCTFQDLTEKVGVVIGLLGVDPSTVSIKNSAFNNCQPWDSDGSIEGVDGLYETDMYTSEFTFITENNTITSNACLHEYLLIESGASSCTLEGYEKFECINCRDIVVRTYAMLEHSHEESERIEASCTGTGSVTYICECGDSYTETLNKLGHAYEIKQTEVTTEEGAAYTLYTYTCADCGYVYTRKGVCLHVDMNNDNICDGCGMANNRIKKPITQEDLEG